MNDDILKKYSNQVYGHRTKTYRSLVIGNLVKNYEKRIEEYEKITQKLESEKDARPNISLTDWNNDYSKRPTQASFNQEQQAKNKVENDLIQEQKKSKQLELERDRLKDQRIKDKKLHTDLQKQVDLLELEIKGEKQMSYQAIQTNAKRIQALQTIIKNLQTKEKEGTEQYNDLQNEYKLLQDLLDQKEELSQTLQKQINDLKEAAKKPETTEMETQTDLTAEQITQMEKDLEYQRKLLYQGGLEIDGLEKELSKINKEQSEKQQTITELQNQVKDLTPNEQEKLLLEYCKLGKWGVGDYPNIKKGIESLSNLREDYLAIKNELLLELNILTRKVEIEKQMEQKNKELSVKNQKLTELQTRYDMEVRSKEELVAQTRQIESFLQPNFYDYKRGTLLTIKEIMEGLRTLTQNMIDINFDNKEKIKQKENNLTQWLNNIQFRKSFWQVVVSKNNMIKEYYKNRFCWDEWANNRVDWIPAQGSLISSIVSNYPSIRSFQFSLSETVPSKPGWFIGETGVGAGFMYGVVQVVYHYYRDKVVI